jgi:hypothetical protein
VLSELSPHLHVVSEADGERREWALADLLPESFDGTFLKGSFLKRAQ